MLYTPKYCCECSEKIDRSEWKLLTSRRFCETCESEFKTQDWLPRLFIGFGLLMTIFGIGSLLKKSDKPLNVTALPNAVVASNKNQSLQNAQVSQQKQVAADAVSQSNIQPPSGTLNQKQPQGKHALSGNGQDSASEIIYFCGAQTKKGTPCTRRVKNGGRCWQHAGQPAMLPPEKLVATQ